MLVVLLSDCSLFTVPKFLMCNLAFADLIMGLYLMLVAAIDLHSTGEYFNIAYHWQYGEFKEGDGDSIFELDELKILNLLSFSFELFEFNF